MTDSRFRILIIDDKRTKREALAMSVEHELGYSVLEAENGLEGLAAARQFDPDLILLDIEMPVMNGHEFLDELKQNSHLSSIPVIVISGKESSEADVVRCIEQGAEDYFSMPIMDQMPVLRARVNSALIRRTQQRKEKKLRDDLEQTYLKLSQAQRQSDELLAAIFPPTIVDELRETKDIKPRRFDDVAVLFTDVVGFTSFCEKHTPEEVMEPLQSLMTGFEHIAKQFGVEKMQTIGDAFLGCAGLVREDPDRVYNTVAAGLEMAKQAPMLSNGWSVRVGVHCGPVLAGKIGTTKYRYDILGDTVNTSARIEANGIADALVVSKAVWDRVAGSCTGSSLGIVELRNRASMELFRVDAVAEKAEQKLAAPAVKG